MNKNLFFGLLGGLALVMTGCSSDEPAKSGNEPAQKDDIRYIRVNIVNPHNISKALLADDQFDDGTPEESAVSAVYFRFFDINGNAIQNAGGQIEDLEWKTETATTNVSHIASATVAVPINRGENYPSYVLCFLNPVEYLELDKLSDYRSAERLDYKNTNNKFSMSNSAYYGFDAATNTQNVKISGTAILPDQLFTTEKDADEAEADEIINIYVERYASKVNFTLPAAERISDIALEGTGNTLKFTPEYWTVNADAASMYAIKRFESTNTAAGTVPTLAEVNTMLGAWADWNDPDRKRSYWGCSPSFYASAFPRVSDDFVDLTGNNAANSYGAGAITTANKDAGYLLKYYSYNQIAGLTPNVTESQKGKSAVIGGTATKYVLENTMGSSAFESLNPKAAAPSALLVGNYRVTFNGTALAENTTFYLYGGNSVFFDSNVAAGAVTIKDKMMNQQLILAIDDNGTMLNATNGTAYASSFAVKHPDKNVRGNYALSMRYVTLQLESLPAGKKLYYQPNGSEQWKEVSADDLTAVNILLSQQLSYAEAFKQGKAYYSIPIRHLGYTESTDGAPETDGQLDWAKVKVGDFGLVRNHVYTIEVASIAGKATGISNLDEPIVPPMEHNNYYIRYSINILAWRIVPTQGGIVL